MRASVIVFPGSNCDRDVAVALAAASGQAPSMVWHGENSLPASDLIVLPGGFSYGDYLRCGAMAAHSPILGEVRRAADRGVPVLGICNGFQILTEMRLLPGALMRNIGLHFICRNVALSVVCTQSPFTRTLDATAEMLLPIAHMDGNYQADTDTLDRLAGEDRIAFRYAPGTNPNGSARDIAGIFNERRTVLGMMPHPERAIDAIHPSTDGKAFFEGIVEALS